MAKTPNLVPALHWIHHIALERRLDSIKADGIVPAATSIFQIGRRIFAPDPHADRRTSKLGGQRTCLLKNMNAGLVELIRSAVEGMEFYLLLFCREVAHFLRSGARVAFALSFI